jgi:hypothetical protein
MKPWALGVLLLIGSDASAQLSQPATRDVTVQRAPVLSSPTKPPEPDWKLKFDFTSPPADESLWKLNLGTSLNAGRNTTLTFGVIGHRGYRLPTYMFESLAPGGPAAAPDASYVDAFARRNWDAHLRVQHLLFRTQRGTTFRAVGDVLIPLGRDDSPPHLQSMRALRSRAFRIGVVIGF